MSQSDGCSLGGYYFNSVSYRRRQQTVSRASIHHIVTGSNRTVRFFVASIWSGRPTAIIFLFRSSFFACINLIITFMTFRLRKLHCFSWNRDDAFYNCCCYTFLYAQLQTDLNGIIPPCSSDYLLTGCYICIIYKVIADIVYNIFFFNIRLILEVNNSCTFGMQQLPSRR